MVPPEPFCARLRVVKDGLGVKFCAELPVKVNVFPLLAVTVSEDKSTLPEQLRLEEPKSSEPDPESILVE